MARITIEDALKLGYNKFELVHLATKRVIELRRGKELLIASSNKEIVAALREIEAGKVRRREATELLPEGFESDVLPADSLLPSDSAVTEVEEASEGTQDTDDSSSTQDEESTEEA